MVKQYFRGYYCRDDMDLEILNKDTNRTILEALRDAHPSGLTAHDIQKKTRLPMNTIYSQLKELYREYFVMETENKKQPKPRGRPSIKKTKNTNTRHRGEVINEDSSGVYDTHEGEEEGKIQLAPGNVQFSSKFIESWENVVEKSDEDEISPVLMAFIEKIYRRTIESNDSITKSFAPVKNVQQCCYQCGVNHEARDFLRAISVYLIDRLQNSKVYVEFLKSNDLLTEDAYQHALTLVERNTKREATRDNLKSTLKRLDKLEKDLKIRI